MASLPNSASIDHVAGFTTVETEIVLETILTFLGTEFTGAGANGVDVHGNDVSGGGRGVNRVGGGGSGSGSAGSASGVGVLVLEFLLIVAFVKIVVDADNDRLPTKESLGTSDNAYEFVFDALTKTTIETIHLGLFGHVKVSSDLVELGDVSVGGASLFKSIETAHGSGLDVGISKVGLERSDEVGEFVEKDRSVLFNIVEPLLGRAVLEVTTHVKGFILVSGEALALEVDSVFDLADEGLDFFVTTVEDTRLLDFDGGVTRIGSSDEGHLTLLIDESGHGGLENGLVVVHERKHFVEVFNVMGECSLSRNRLRGRDVGRKTGIHGIVDVVDRHGARLSERGTGKINRAGGEIKLVRTNDRKRNKKESQSRVHTN